MNVSAFLEKLSQLYEIDKNNEIFKERAGRYIRILKQKETNSGKKIDYESTLDKIITNYPYRIYPNFTEILKNLVYCSIENNFNQQEQGFKPRKFRLTTKSKHIYEFEEVPPSWESIRSVSELKEKGKLDEIIEC